MMTSQLKRCVVTGATGFIGVRLVNYLDEIGISVCLLTRKKNTNRETIVCDLLSSDYSIITFSGVDTVFHLAGLAHTASEDSLYRSLNVDATGSLLRLAASAGVKRFIYVSSVKAGGYFLDKCMSESDQCEPVGAYGQSKREAELRVLEIGRKSGMHVSIIRPSLVYGPKVKGNLASMRSAIEKGWFPPLPKLSNRRSMVHVDDLVRAIVWVAKDVRANGGIFIVTDGRVYSSREIFEAICLVVGRRIPSWSIPKFLFDVVSLVDQRIFNKVNKLIGDECYSSKKIEALGFYAKRTLRDMDETDF